MSCCRAFRSYFQPMYEQLNWREIDLYDDNRSALEDFLRHKDRLLFVRIINLWYYNSAENHEIFIAVLQRCKNVKDIRLRNFRSINTEIECHEMIESIAKENLKKLHSSRLNLIVNL